VRLNDGDRAVLEREGYAIDVKIRHPTWMASHLIIGMGCEPDISWDVGEEHRSPSSGALLGVRKITYWCVWNHVEGRRNFFAEFKNICEWLKAKKPFLDEIRATGGSVAVDIGLRGSVNIGSSLDPAHLRLAGELGVTLGIEVFPQMNPSEESDGPPW
jgi:hypothetical protein